MERYGLTAGKSAHRAPLFSAGHRGSTDATHAGRRHFRACGHQRAADVDRAAGVLDDQRLQPGRGRVDRAESDTEIGGEAGKKTRSRPRARSIAAISVLDPLASAKAEYQSTPERTPLRRMRKACGSPSPE